MSSTETNPDKRPLPDGWITEHSPQWNAWYYVDTKSANPQAIWTHPSESTPGPTTPSPAYTSEPHAGHSITSAPSAPAAGQPVNPDTRPLPPGYVSQYSPEHKTFFYVNETAADPGSTVTWTHPAETHGPPPTDLKSPATASTQAAHVGPAAAATSSHQNPDKRDLPPGWKTDYDADYKAWFYVNTHDPSGTTSWTHPADTHGPSAVPPPSQPSAAGTSAAAPAHKVAEPHAYDSHTSPPSGPSAAQKENPDKRPLPAGWITKFDENYGVWYYVDTNKPGGTPSWEHPAGNAPPAGHGTPGGATPYGGTNQPYGAQPNQGAPGAGGGIEGLLGGSAGKMIGGLFGAKGRAQMDTFANKLAPEVQKIKGKYATPSGQGHAGAQGHGQGGYGAPPTPGQGQYGPPAGHAPSPGQGHAQGYGAPPSQGGYPGAGPGQQQQQGYNPGYPGGGQSQQHGGGGGGSMNLSGMAGKFSGFLKK